MTCKNVCKICPNLVISSSVSFDPTTNSLDITIPSGVYANCQKVCIVVAQTIPTSTTINALVNIVIDGVRFPLQQCDCRQISSCQIKTRTKYSTRVFTNTVSGVFRLLGKVYPCCPDNLATLPTATVAADGVAPASIVTPTAAFNPQENVVATRTTTKSKKEVTVNE